MHAKHLALLSLLTGAIAVPMPQAGGGAMDGSACATHGQVVCSDDGMMIYQCTWKKLKKLSAAPMGTKCVNGMLVNAKSGAGNSGSPPMSGGSPPMSGGSPPMSGGSSPGYNAPPPPPMSGGSSSGSGGSPPMNGGSPPMNGGSPPMYGGSPPMSGGSSSGSGGSPPMNGGSPPMYGGSPPMDGGSSPANGGSYGSGNNGGDSDSAPSPTMTVMVTATAHATSTQVTVVTETGSPNNMAPPPPSGGDSEKRGSGSSSSITEQQVLAAAPESKSCKDTKECVTAGVAAKAISDSFAKYSISSVGEKAAILSLIILESGSFQYKTNHFPGRPGQGTRNMMMPNFIYDYAKDVDAGALAKAAPGISSGDALMNAKNETKVAVLDIVNKSDDLSFGSAAWFLTAKCDKSIRDGLAKGDEAGWEKYITDCIHTTAAPERKTGWQKALDALKG